VVLYDCSTTDHVLLLHSHIAASMFLLQVLQAMMSVTALRESA
jgi:hypothetical protein